MACSLITYWMKNSRIGLFPSGRLRMIPIRSGADCSSSFTPNSSRTSRVIEEKISPIIALEMSWSLAEFRISWKICRTLGKMRNLELEFLIPLPRVRDGHQECLAFHNALQPNHCVGLKLFGDQMTTIELQLRWHRSCRLACCRRFVGPNQEAVHN